MSSVLTPSLVGQYIKNFMDRDPLLSSILVRGEISNYKRYPSGHHYFTLKDSEGALRCVMFRGDAISMRFQPQNGMQVIAAGRISVFPRDGQYQMYCSRLTPEGAGDLHVAFEQLKEKLLGEGLFAQEKKKRLPRYPGRIALVTSPAGAAVRDMLRILNARWPMAEVCVIPVRVQGDGAAGEIAAAIRWVNREALADLIITGRGGGSMEDLWAFNEECVARAIYNSEIPVISAVGHEPDVTIADFVADLRAATPSNAAELAVPDMEEITQLLAQRRQRLEQATDRMLSRWRQRLEHAADSRPMRAPQAYFSEKRQLLDYEQHRLQNAAVQDLARERQRLAAAAAALDALSPIKVLARGYAIAHGEDGAVITSQNEVTAGQHIRVKLYEGELHCMVE